MKIPIDNGIFLFYCIYIKSNNVAKVKVVTNNLDYNLNREEFTDFSSQTIFSFGRFAITSNFDGRKFIDYSKRLSSFVAPITLETLELTNKQSEVILKKTNDLGLNLDNSNFSKFVRFGSAYEYLRVSVEEIITKYPGSVYADNQISGGVITFFDFEYNIQQDIATFYIPISILVNNFGIIYLDGNEVIPDENKLRNLNISFNDYVIWSNNPDSNDVIAPIIGFTGYTQSNPNIRVQTRGNPFDGIFETIPSTGASISFHIKPNSIKFEEFRQNLTDYQKYVISKRNDNGFVFEIKEPILLDNGNIEYNTINLVWPSSDDYNINFTGVSYRNFLDGLIGIGSKYDAIKTDLIARFLTPAALKTYDLTEDGKITKLLRVYGWEFDQLRLFIDSIAYVNRVTYDKKNNAPDQLITNLAKLFGWEYFSLVNESELVKSLLTIDENEANLNEDFLPVEIDIELWRRIIMNANYFWKTKGTREAIKAMFLMIGIPAPFINITEYVYTVSEKINPNQVTLRPMDFVSNTYPFDRNGYPIAPPETNDFYFQISGNSDAGQAYMNNFRQAGFLLERTIDNKKSWSQEGEVLRQHESTIQYFQRDSKLVLNTKEVDIGLDSARGIEEDVFNYMQIDYSANSSGYLLPISYVNLSLVRSGNNTTFTLPERYKEELGDIEVRWNGILLNAPKTGTTSGITEYSDYIINGNQITIPAISGISETDGRNVLQVTFLYSGGTSPITEMTVQYVVTRIRPDISGTLIILPTVARGDIQLTINGIALTPKRTPQFNADYLIDNTDTGQTKIVITNPAVIAYFLDIEKMEGNPYVQVTYVEVDGGDSIEARSEIHRVDSFTGTKFYFNSFANKFVFILNYRIRNIENVKILVDGIALEPVNDYIVNPSNSYEIYLPRTIRFGSIISAYYLVGGEEFFDAIIDDIHGLGDITKMSFLEFAELAQRRLINARTRKIVTDFKGGWYPTLLKIYNEYLKRAELSNDDPLQSNGYTFENLFGFLSKYNSFFERFIKQLVSATIIIRKSGLLVRNSMFTRQKFTYKRGVAFNYKTDKSFNTELNYLGDAGSIFLIPQQATTLTPSLNTIVGTTDRTFNSHTGMHVFSINSTGGNNIIMFDSAQRFGLEYRKVGDVVWIDSPNPPYDKSLWDVNNALIPQLPILTNDSFSLHSITELMPNTIYEYRAFIEINGIRTYGQILQTQTAILPPQNPSIDTITGIANITYDIDTDTHRFWISGTGGNNIVRSEDAQFYGMLYKQSNQDWTHALCKECNAGITPIIGNQFSMSIVDNLNPSTTYDYNAYISIDGNKVCGISKTITMLEIPQTLPIVTTGVATDITQTSMMIAGNVVTDNGNATINQYGVAWTHVPSLANDNWLRVGNSGVHHTCVNLSINENIPYNIMLSNLPSNTMTWYRATARNTVGLNYGIIREQRTLAPQPIEFTLILEIQSEHTNTEFSGLVRIINADNLSEVIRSINIPINNYFLGEFIIPATYLSYILDASTIFGVAPPPTGSYTLNTYDWFSSTLMQNITSPNMTQTLPIINDKHMMVRLNVEGFPPTGGLPPVYQ